MALLSRKAPSAAVFSGNTLSEAVIRVTGCGVSSNSSPAAGHVITGGEDGWCSVRHQRAKVKQDLLDPSSPHSLRAR